MAGKVCTEAGCPNLKPCPVHAPIKKPWASSNRRAELPANWTTEIVPRIKRRDRYRCQECGGAICGNEKLEVDHIGDPMDHSDSNLQTLGFVCHRRKTLREARNRSRQSQEQSIGPPAQRPKPPRRRR